MGPGVSGTVESLLAAALAAGAVGAVGAIAVRRGLRRSSPSAPLLALLVPVAMVSAGVAAAAATMLLDPAQTRTMGLVLLVTAIASAGLGVMLSRQVRRVEQDPASMLEERRRVAARDADRRETMGWISHDLRSPLARLQAMSEALQDGIGGGPDHYVPLMGRQIEAMRMMVDDLMLLSRLAESVPVRAADDIDVPDLISDAIAAQTTEAAQRGVRLGGDCEPALLLHGDAAAVARALTNLVDNAVRHTPAGGQVTIGARAQDDGVLIAVTDGCGGIDPADLPSLFSPGWRGDPARGQDGGAGAGLGLAIVSAVGAAHDGRVAVTNIGGGCRFELLLRDRASGPAPADRSA